MDRTKIIVISPIASLLFTQELQKKLESAGDVVFITNIRPLLEITDLYTQAPKVVAIDPDFCDWKFTAEIIAKMKNVQAICLQTTSFAWIDTAAAKTNNIPVVNLRGFSTYAVAEWAVMMAMNVARKIPLLMKEGWKQDFERYQGIELRGRKAGIIGLGNIGTRIAEICQGLGMEVVYWSRNSVDGRFVRTDMETLMRESDVIFPTFAKSEETLKLISDELLVSMKPGAIISNIAGKVCNHDLLLKMVKEGNLYGYAFESGSAKMEDFDGNVWAAPELAWCTNGSMIRNAERWTEAIVQATRGEFPNLVS